MLASDSESEATSVEDDPSLLPALEYCVLRDLYIYYPYSDILWASGATASYFMNNLAGQCLAAFVGTYLKFGK